MKTNMSLLICAMLALAVPTVSIAVAQQAATPTTLPQPLTRDDCGKAGMVWNDNANVCGDARQTTGTKPEVRLAKPESELTDTGGQPLTRDACDKAGMAWNDNANVCGDKAATSATQSLAEEANAIGSAVLINIDKATQRMTVFVDGVQQYDWPVSTGRRGYSTPSGTYTARSMNKIWYSRQWDNAPMFHAIFFTKMGHAIHGTLEERNLGKAASHGCVRISQANAATLFTLVEQTGLDKTEVVLTGTTLGGEAKVTRDTANRQAFDPFPQRPRRGGFFRRLFGGP